VKWKLESDEYFGVWYLLPWIVVSPPNYPVIAERHWGFSIGWLRWGVTLVVTPKP
jgi:hypothetical protein